MKTCTLFIILFALTGLVNAMQPSIPTLVNSPSNESGIITAQGRTPGSKVHDRLISRVNNQGEVTKLSSDDVPLNAPQPPVNFNDSVALVALYRATNGPEWTNNDGWLTGRVSTWHGIDYVNPSGRVEEINLNNNNLQGPIHDSIGYLTALTTLNMAYNQLTGSVPGEIGNLDLLWSLFLNDNQLSGSIPSSIGGLVNVYQLNLSNNLFSGDFPPEIGNLPILMYLYLSSNQFTGNILNNLTTQTYLIKIDISNNQFSGTIPGEIGNFSDLGEFYINQNGFIFNDIESIFEWTNYSNFSSFFSYSDQDSVGVADTLTISLGEGFHISITGYEPGPHDNFQWYLDKTLLPSETDSFLSVTSAIPANMGDYYCEITNSVATDLTLYSRTVSVRNSNVAPVANAGANQSIYEGDLVTLDGSASSDADLNPLTYLWTPPAGITLSDISLVDPTFTAPEVVMDTTYIFILVVNDGSVDSQPDTVLITIKQMNKAPVANAGIDQTVDRNDLVSLDGSASSDADLDPLTYLWTPPAGITLSDNTIVKPTFTSPDIEVDSVFAFVLLVNDGHIDSQPDTVLITVAPNLNIPIANASNNQEVNEGDEVILDGSGSSDADLDPLTYQWTAPAGIILSDAEAVNPTFTAPEITKDTTYTFVLVVNDGFDNSQPDTVLIMNKQVNKIPVANAGVDQIVEENVLITLDGSTSSDADGDSLTFQWTAPVGITLSDVTAESPTFTAPEVTKDTTYTFVLVVNDRSVDSQPDTVLITVEQVNIIPVANAGADQTVDENVLVTLDGTSSTDGDGESLTYQWTPPSVITLSSNTAAKPTFTAVVTKDTIYLFKLVVYDGTDYSNPDTVLITVQNIATVPETLAVQNVNLGSGATECYDALQTITVAGGSTIVNFQSGSFVDLIAGQRISFLPGFHALSGSTVHAYITTTASYCTPSGSIAMDNDETIKSKAVEPSETRDESTLKEKTVKVYPNPNDGRFTVELSNFDSPAQLTIVNTLGVVVLNKTSITGENQLLDISYLNRGLYFVKVKSDQFLKTQKIIIR